MIQETEYYCIIHNIKIRDNWFCRKCEKIVPMARSVVKAIDIFDQATIKGSLPPIEE